MATLGRGGTDLTATLLGRALGARAVTLWKDVPGLLTADPRVVPDARVIPQLHLREAAELAYYGAKVLHPRALIPVAGRAHPRVRAPVRRPARGGDGDLGAADAGQVPGQGALGRLGGQALITVAGNGMLGVPGIAARTFEALHRQGISVSLISQSSSEQSICFSVPEGAAQPRPGAPGRGVPRPRSPARRSTASRSSPGSPRWRSSGWAWPGTSGSRRGCSRALAKARINIVAIAQGSSELNISFVVAAKDAAAAQRAVHDAFQLAKIGGGAAARAAHSDAVLLGFGQIGRALAGIIVPAAREEPEAAPRRRDRPQRLRVRPDGARPARPSPRCRPPSRRAGAWPRPRGAACATPTEALAFLAEHALCESDPGRRDRGRHDAARAAGAGRGHGRRARQQAACCPARASAERGAGGARRAGRPPHADRGHRRRGAADLRHLPQAGRVGRSGAQDRGLPVGHARLRHDRGRARALVLRGPPRRDGQGLHRARPARRSVGRRRRPQGADPRPAARLPGRAGRRGRRVAGAGRPARHARRGVPGPPPRAWTPTGPSEPPTPRRRGERCATSPPWPRTGLPSA